MGTPELIARLRERAEYEDNGGVVELQLFDMGALLRKAADALERLFALVASGGETLTRYEITAATGMLDHPMVCSEPKPTGDWVKYRDAAKALRTANTERDAALAARTKAIETALREVRSWIDEKSWANNFNCDRAFQIIDAALQPEPGTQGRVITPTTTDELDRILNSEDDTPVHITPDGRVVPLDEPRDAVAARIVALADAQKRIAELERERDAEQRMRQEGVRMARRAILRAEAAEASAARLRKAVEDAIVAFEIIAGKRQCIDNLMGNRDVAEQALGIIDAALNPKTET